MRTHRVVVAPDKFKGSCTAQEAAQALVDGIRRTAGTPVDALVVPVADGGEGTLEAAVHAGFTLRTADVTGPTGHPVTAAFAVRGREAVVEMARASGLAVLPGGEPDATRATSRGTGELVRAALDLGCDRVVVGVGGSACTDGGAGLLQALGVRLLDREGGELPVGGAALAGLARVDLDGLDPRLPAAEVVLAGDVRNPLLGPDGAAAVFGPQKGASPEQVAELDAALSHLVAVLDKSVGDELVRRTGRSARESAHVAGAGAAGGVGFAVLGVLGGESRSGIDVVLELVGFAGALDGARLVVTGEGSLDEQTLGGKAPVGVARAAAAAGVPVVAVCGRLALTEDAWRGAGFDAVRALADRAPDAETSMRDARRLLEEVGAEIGDGLRIATLEHAGTTGGDR